MIRLVCIDVDGTLVGHDGEVAPPVWAAATRARAAGIRLALCTGRPGFGIARQWAAQLDDAGWHVFQNGASVIRLGDGASRSVPLPVGAVPMLIERARSHDRLLELYGDDAYACERDTPRGRAHAALLQVPLSSLPFAALAQPVVRAQWLLAHDELDAVLAEPCPGLEPVHSTSPVMPDTVFVNMTAAGVGKHTGVRLVAAAYGIALDDVMVIGDAHNDLLAMREVGWPVAMGNAVPELRALARVVVADVEHHGVAEALALACASV